jgi:uncharacterized protein with gpF-like domain
VSFDLRRADVSTNKTISPIRPNVGIIREYRRRLEKLIEEMHRSVLYWIRSIYRKRPPELHRLHKRIVFDASPTSDIHDQMQRLSARWKRRFNLLAKTLASAFADRVSRRSETQLIDAMKRWGESIKFRRTRAANDVLQAAVAENVALIKSIPEKYLSDVETSVMRSVQRGADINYLTDDLENKFRVTHRRAELIARDQTNKVTAYYARTRFAELGIRQAVWVHNGSVRHPRSSHLKAGRDHIVFDLSTGWYDPEEQRYVVPGELINCRCVARPILPGID